MSRASFFQRVLLPGFAFKAVVIGGGYATGRELVEFFFPSGPVGGLLGLLLTMIVWSGVCTATFLFAQATHSLDYRTFFRNLLGRGWVVFEAAYLLLILLILAVFGAAAGEIGASLFGLPLIVGTLALMAAITFVAAFGSSAVERLFKYVTFFLYGVYALFVVLAISRFGPEIPKALSTGGIGGNWVQGGLTYASYNVVGAVVILPVVRHLTTRRDAVVAGLLCGPLAAAPAILFFACMLAFYPEIGAATLPSDYMLSRLGFPAFHVVFQLMIFAALLESGAGLIHALNERAAAAFVARGRPIPAWLRPALSLGALVAAIFVATRFGLVELIAKGYGASAIVFLAIFIIPLLTLGLWRLRRRPDPLEYAP